MNQTNTQENVETNNVKNSYDWKANELVLWMDNTEELYNIKQVWIENYNKKINKGEFSYNLSIHGMDNLRKQIQRHYNKHFPEDTIKISKEELRPICIALLESILYGIWEINEQHRETISYYIGLGK